MSPMSPAEKIAKLESLLARVKERTEAPRRAGAAPIPAPEPAAQPAAATAPEPPAPMTVQDLPPVALPSAPPPAELSSGWSEPPAVLDAGPETAADPVVEMGDDMEVEVSAEVVEVDIDIDEPGMFPAESGAQPVADALANGAAEPEAELEELASDASAPPAAEPEPEPAPELEPEPVIAGNEVIEPAPSSSPRPIAVEPPAYEEESAPRHTPPPESGKQVAAPSVKPEPASWKVSAPPPSLESHTLIGGWREPGMAIPREAAEPRVPAVRVPPPPPPPPPDAFAPQARTGSVSPRAGEPSSIGPVVTKPELPESAQVATIEGVAPQFAPATFGDLLDATLAL